MIIGVAGGTGSGKTSLTQAIAQRFGADVTVLNHDNYYRAHDEMPYEQRCQINYDHPDALETSLLVEHLRQLRAGQSIQCPVYDFSQHNRSRETVTVTPSRVIVVEGILIFAEPVLCDLMDIRIFVDTDADVRILRRIRRDVQQRGRSLDSVIDQYLATVKPMHEQFVEPSKRRADIIIPEGAHNPVALEMILNRIENQLIKGENDHDL